MDETLHLSMLLLSLQALLAAACSQKLHFRHMITHATPRSSTADQHVDQKFGAIILQQPRQTTAAADRRSPPSFAPMCLSPFPSSSEPALPNRSRSSSSSRSRHLCLCSVYLPRTLSSPSLCGLRSASGQHLQHTTRGVLLDFLHTPHAYLE